MTLGTLRLRMIYTSVGVTSAIVFEQGFEFPTFKLSKTKRIVSLFHHVALRPAAPSFSKDIIVTGQMQSQSYNDFSNREEKKRAFLEKVFFSFSKPIMEGMGFCAKNMLYCIKKYVFCAIDIEN